MEITASIRFGDFRSFEAAVLKACAQRLDAASTKAQSGIEKTLREAIVTKLKGTQEYISLLNGDLWHELGVLSPDSVVDSILQVLAGGVRVISKGYRAVGSRIEGGLLVEIIKDGIAKVLTVPQASFTSENGYGVEWLRWLLTEGENIVIDDYVYHPGHEQWSRTGYGIMVSSQNGWSVPAEFAGTVGNNWFTRGLKDLRPIVAEAIEHNLKANL